MQNVSDEFQQAVLDVQRMIRAKLEMDLFPVFNETPPVGTATSSGAYIPAGYTVSPYPASAAFNQKLTIDPVQSAKVVGNDPTYVPPSDGSMGWWGSTLSSPTGTFATEQNLTMDYGSIQRITGFVVYGDRTLGFPVDFTIYTSADQATWVPQVTVLGNTQYIFGRALGTTILSRYVRLGITRISRGDAYPVVVEFSTRWLISSDNILSDRIKSISIKEEAFYDDASAIPIGNYSAATCDIEIDNYDGLFYQRNINSPYYGYLRPNRKVKVWFGLLVPDDPAADADGYVWLPKGTYYTRVFSGSLASGTTKIQCWNRAKLLAEKPYDGSAIIERKTLTQLMTIILNSVDVPSSEQNIQQTFDIIEYAYFEPGNVWGQLGQLATAEAGYLFVDELNRVTFKDRSFYYSSRLTFGVQPGDRIVNVKFVGSTEVGDAVYIIDGDQMDGYTILNVNINPDGVSGSFELTTPVVRAANVGAYVSRTSPVVYLREDNALTDLDDGWSVERMKNFITIVTNPLIIMRDDDGTIPASGRNVFHRDEKEALRLLPGETVTLKIDFQNKPVFNTSRYPVTVAVGVYDSNAPITPEDPNGDLWMDPPYIVKQWVDKYGFGASGPYAWGGYLLLKNNDTQARIFSDIVVSGWYLERKGGIIEHAKDLQLISEYGEKEYKLDSPYVFSREHAKRLAHDLLGTWSNPLAPLTIPLPGRGLFHIQLGDRVIVRSDTEGLTAGANNSHFYVVRQSLTFDGSLSGELECIAAS